MEPCSSHLAPLATRTWTTIRSPQLSGQLQPPNPPSPPGRSGPYLCYPVASPTPLSPEGTQKSGHCTYRRASRRYQGPEVLPSAARPALRALRTLALIVHAGQATHSSPGGPSPVPVPAIAAVAGVALRLGPGE